MILQEVLVEQLEESELYVRQKGDLKIKEHKLFFCKNAEILTNTYYNSFSIGKWSKYCSVEDIKLHVCLQGKFRLQIYYAYLKENELKEINIEESIIESEGKKSISYDIPKREEGVVYFRLIALKDNSILYNAFYDGKTEIESNIVIALNICTYKREKYLLKNLEILQSTFLNNQKSPLYNRLKIFVTDNGNTLDRNALSAENIFVFHNPNLGGAGGFTRGLIEINRKKKDLGVTNIIFMDDDVEIEPEAIIRTYRMLKILKKEYNKAFIGGAMLRLDRKYVQHENGALWNAGKCVFVNRGLDLREFKNVVYNELEQKRDYAAWWYCCIPASIINDNNLPIPIFIHQDDTEFSLRNAEHIITMNGIAIWHSADEHTRLSTNEYYNLRNMLIVNAKYCKGFNITKVKREVFSRMLVALLRYRYRDMHLIYKAIMDFCRGPKFLIESDTAGLHDELRKSGYRFVDISKDMIDTDINGIEKIIESPFAEKKKRWTYKKVLKLFFLVVTSNGWLFPAKDTEYHYMDVHPAKLYRTGKVVLYDGNEKGIYVERKFWQILVFIKLYIKSCIKLKKEYENAKKRYCNEWNKMCELQTWMKQIERVEGI